MLICLVLPWTCWFLAKHMVFNNGCSSCSPHSFLLQKGVDFLFLQHHWPSLHQSTRLFRLGCSTLYSSATFVYSGDVIWTCKCGRYIHYVIFHNILTLTKGRFTMLESLSLCSDLRRILLPTLCHNHNWSVGIISSKGSCCLSEKFCLCHYTWKCAYFSKPVSHFK